MAKSGTRSLVRETPLSTPHPLLRSLPWFLFCDVHDLCSVSRRIASMFQFSRIVRDRLPFVSMLSRVSPHFRLDSSPWRPRCSHHRRCTRSCSSAAARRLLCNCQDTSILTSQWPPCKCDRRNTRTQFLHASHRCSRITESTVFKRTHHKDRRQLQLFQRLALHDRTASCVCARSRHICSISFCLCVPTERDKYVWLVQSLRRPVKWTRTWKAGSRGSATPDPVS